MIRRTTLILLLMVSGCQRCDSTVPVTDAGAIDAGPATLSEKEPNDTSAQALVIERSTVVEANLSADPSKADVDWYALTASLPKTAEVKVTPPPGADVAIEVVDATGTVLATIDSEGVGGGERLPWLDVSSVSYVRVVGRKKGVGGAYSLAVSFRERHPGYELEPNEKKVDATAVALGQAISGTVGHGGDVDVYRYELPGHEPSQVEAPPAELEADDAGEPKERGDAAVAEPSDAGPPAIDAGLVEPRLALRIDLSATEGVAPEVQVLTEAEAVLFSAKAEVGAALSLRNVGVRAADHVIYLVVRGGLVGSGKTAKRGANPDVSYTLTVSPEDSGGSSELEPNDELSRATDLAPNTFRDGFLSPAGDVDFYRLVTDGPSVVKLELSGVDKVDLQLSVVRPVEGKPDEVLLKTNEGVVREPEQLNAVACPGVCWVRVESVARKVDGKFVRTDDNSEQSYRLNALVTPDDGSEEKEPNNASGTATQLTLGTPIRGTVYPKKDADFFVVDLTERPIKTALSATLTGVLKVDVGLYLHRVEEDGKLTLVQTSDSAKGERAESIRFTAEPGKYVFEVRDAKNREANFQDSYQLSVDEASE